MTEALRLSNRCTHNVRGRMCRHPVTHWYLDGSYEWGMCSYHWNLERSSHE
jgi:hypothetical protein